MKVSQKCPKSVHYNVVNIGFVRAKANSEKNDFSPSRKCRLKSNEKYQNLVLPQQQDKKSTISIKFKNFLPTYVSQLKIGQNADFGQHFIHYSRTQSYDF
jgi:hypothetical protein